MNLRFLPKTGEGPVLFFAQATPEDAQSLKIALDGLAEGRESVVHLDSLPGIVAEDGCELVATSHASGVTVRSGAGRFVWSLRPLQWETVAGLVEPFASSLTHADVHQHLGQAGAATVIISTTDQW
jgi:hypothetical protein